MKIFLTLLKKIENRNAFTLKLANEKLMVF